MALFLIRSGREFRSFGEKIYKFKLCSCLFDMMYFAIRTFQSIDDFWRLYSIKKELGKEFYWNYHYSCYIGCCKTYIEWAIRVDYDLLERNEKFSDLETIGS